jgi:hypothetical protein
MYMQIKTERGSVRVIEAACKNRPCLHVHWSRHAGSTTVPESGKNKGAKVSVFPLVCVRNEEHGCPHPLPAPVKL